MILVCIILRRYHRLVVLENGVQRVMEIRVQRVLENRVQRVLQNKVQSPRE